MTDTTRHVYSPEEAPTWAGRTLCTECDQIESHPCHDPAPARETTVSTAEADILVGRIEALLERMPELLKALAWYRAADERDVEGGVLRSIFERPAAKVLAACYTKESKQ